MAQTRLKLVTLVSVIITASVQADVIGVRLNNNGRCLITDTQYVLGQVSSAHPNAESRVGCPAGTIATSCQCDATLNGCKSAWFYENNQCVALNHGRNHIGTMANVTCVEFTCDNNYRVQMETFESHDVGYPSVQCPSWMKRIGCYVRISSKLGTTIYGQGKIKGNTCQCGPSTDNEETCSAFVQCQAVYKNEFTDVAIEERCVDYITISWSMEGDPTDVPGYAITIDPATVEGQNSIPLQGEELLNELYDPSTGRMVYTIASLEAGLLYRICVNLLDSSCGVTDRISLLSDDICQQTGNPCENGGTCCDDGEGYVCHCTEKYTGIHCEDQINPCDPNPCQNGGMCVRQGEGFDCSCPVGYDGEICEELVLVPVDSETIEVLALCTSATIRWQESGVGLAPERYEVEGSQLSGSERHVLCASEHPVTSCVATDLARDATYLFGVVSIAGTERAESDVESFTMAGE
ncbi:uncharacterized protein [Ptychodera flava]|uniref:uncharacterized protein n=1 Tax=Ptychodera flava TaxID=63121 RepID=UPI00396A2600